MANDALFLLFAHPLIDKMNPNSRRNENVWNHCWTFSDLQTAYQFAVQRVDAGPIKIMQGEKQIMIVYHNMYE
jgi:hypothetical protein